MSEEPLTAFPRRRWRQALIAGALLVVLLVAAWVGVTAVKALFQTNPRLLRLLGNPLPVRVAEVTREELVEVIGGATLGEGFLKISINTVVSQGKVKAVKVDLGQLVKSGEVLLEFDKDIYREALERSRLEIATAKAELRKLEAEQQTRMVELRGAAATAKQRVTYLANSEKTASNAYQRTKTLSEKGVVALAELEQAKVKWDEVQSALALAVQEVLKAEDALKNEPVVIQALLEAVRSKLGTAELEFATARKNLENTVVVAPRAGVIAERRVEPGEWMTGGRTLFVLDQTDPIYAVAPIEQEKSSYVSLGLIAEVVFDAYPTRVHQGRVEKINLAIDPAKRTFKVYVLLENPSLELRPGMAAFTRLKNVRHVTLIPRLAVINPTGAPSIDATVFVVSGSTVAVRKVKLGRSEGLGRIEVLGGIREGEWVVIHGQHDLQPGDRVTAQKAGPAKNPVKK